jgi:hypothetical protein
MFWNQAEISFVAIGSKMNENKIEDMDESEILFRLDNFGMLPFEMNWQVCKPLLEALMAIEKAGNGKPIPMSLMCDLERWLKEALEND